MPKCLPDSRPGPALIFDMDGVIVHSNPVHRQAWEAYNLRFGIVTTEAMLRRMYGRHNGDIVRDYFGAHLSEEEVARHGAAKEALYREMMRPRLAAALVPGVREFLERNAGRPMAVATNAERANLDFILDTAGLRGCFEVAVSGEAAQPKPSPDIYLHTAARLGVAPADCLVFEDSLAGVESARAAGMRVVALRTTHAEIPGADLEIDDFRSPLLDAWIEAACA